MYVNRIQLPFTYTHSVNLLETQLHCRDVLVLQQITPFPRKYEHLDHIELFNEDCCPTTAVIARMLYTAVQSMLYTAVYLAKHPEEAS